jgi:hypothetical protein
MAASAWILQPRSSCSPIATPDRGRALPISSSPTPATASPPSAPEAQWRTSPQAQPRADALAQQLYDAGERTVQQIADIFSVPRTTVYGHLQQSSKGQASRCPADS